MKWDEPRGMIWLDRLRASRTAEEVGLSPLTVFVQRYFKLKERNTTILRELTTGVLHFISVAFILSVNAILLSENAGYQSNKVAAATALSTGISCLICGALSNLPFVLAPTTSTSLYFALYLQNHNMSTKEGNMAVLLLALLFTLCGFRPVALFISNLIPFVMKVGVCLGVGLLIALEALYEIGLVKVCPNILLV
jgi:AGZA family xanthine/uracil permease-like MFS transporter